MSVRRTGWDELLFGALLVAGIVTIGLPRLPAPGVRLSVVPSLAAGVLAGAALFRLLAGSRARLPSRARVGTLIGARGGVLLARAALEEVAWRGFLLGALVGPLGWVGALGVTSAAFACAHGGVRGRLRLVHVLTGAVFGGLYLACGRLPSAVAAHVVYNALVVTGAPAERS